MLPSIAFGRGLDFEMSVYVQVTVHSHPSFCEQLVCMLHSSMLGKEMPQPAR